MEVNGKKNDIKILIEQIQILIRAENEKLENNLIGDIEEHNEHHKLIKKYDEIFNDETLGELRILLNRILEREKRKRLYNDWILKTAFGSFTIGILGMLYTICNYVFTNISNIF